MLTDRVYQFDYSRLVILKGRESSERFSMLVCMSEMPNDNISDVMEEFGKAVQKYGYEKVKIISGPTLVFEGPVWSQHLQQALSV